MKSRLLQTLKTLFRLPASPEAGEARIQEALHESASRLRTVDPQTQRRWLQLQSAMKSVDTAAVLPRSRIMPRLAFGAAALAVLATAVYLYTSSPQSPPETFTTRMGEQKEVVLGDGSQVTLSYASELVASAQRPDKPRRLSLTGEAYFRVRHTGTPFIVSTQYADVEVVGTEFDVRERDGGVEIGVVTGTVRVRSIKDGKDSTLLLAQHQVAVCPLNGFPRRVEDISSPDYPGWLHSKLLLYGTSFQAACRELEMRFDVTVAIHDPTVREKVITGILDARTAESGLNALCVLTGKKLTHAGKTYIID